MLTSRSSKKQPESNAKKQSRPPRSKPTTDDWADVTEPEERRRIQNRLAQRKFREKAKEQKEKAERESRDLEHADSSYRLPTTDELAEEEDASLSGLPWGSLSMKHVLARGHETESRKSSANGSGNGGDFSPHGDAPQYYATSGPYLPHQTACYSANANSSGEDDFSYQDLSYYYDLDANNGHGHGHSSHHQA
ncbi:telomere length regulation protein [Hypoxylon texense]